MSLLSLHLRGQSREKEERELENSALGRLARTHFRQITPPQYSRKEPKQPLLKATPDGDKDIVIRIWRVMMRFAGDMTDYRQGQTQTRQPNLGSVMSRLQKDLFAPVVESSGDVGEGLSTDGTTSEIDALSVSELSTTPKVGTLRRLQASLMARLSQPRPSSVFHSLPLENTLRTPLEQVHFVVGCGILKPSIRDELYCHVCKQLVKNPYKTSSARCWLLLGLLIGCFPPRSSEISDSVLAFIEEGPPIYSEPLKKLMMKSMKNGARFQPPSYVELESLIKKRPVELQITLMDGTVQTVIADGTSTARQVCMDVCDGLGLRLKFGYSLFIAMGSKVASLGAGGHRVMDAISQCEQLHRTQQETPTDSAAPSRLFYRKEVFAPWDDTAGDMMALGLTYSQITRGILLEEYTCDTDQDLAVLAARQFYVEYGPDLNEDSLHSSLPSYIPPSRRQEADSLMLWRRAVVKAYHRLFKIRSSKRPTIDKVKLDVVQYAKTKWTMSFSIYFDVSKLEGPEWTTDCRKLAINTSGVFVMSLENRMLMEISYPEIITIREERSSSSDPSPGNDIISLVLADGSFIKFQSVDASDIHEIVSYIIRGLRSRSVWAIIRENVHNLSSDHQEGDLVELEEPAGKSALLHDFCAGRNLRAKASGRIMSRVLYVLPVLSKPSEDTVKPFKVTKRRQSLGNDLDQSVQPEPNERERVSNALTVANIEIIDEQDPATVPTESSGRLHSTAVSSGDSDKCGSDSIGHDSLGPTNDVILDGLSQDSGNYDNGRDDSSSECSMHLEIVK